MLWTDSAFNCKQQRDWYNSRNQVILIWWEKPCWDACASQDLVLDTVQKPKENVYKQSKLLSQMMLSQTWAHFHVIPSFNSHKDAFLNRFLFLIISQGIFQRNIPFLTEAFSKKSKWDKKAERIHEGGLAGKTNQIKNKILTNEPQTIPPGDMDCWYSPSGSPTPTYCPPCCWHRCKQAPEAPTLLQLLAHRPTYTQKHIHRHMHVMYVPRNQPQIAA